MFYLNVLRINRLNARKLNAFIMNSMNTRSRFNDSIDSSAVNRRPNSNEFVLNKLFRKDILQTVFVLSQNISKGNRSLNELIDEKELKHICETIESNLKYLKDIELINGLHSFLIMNFDPNSRIVQNLENRLLWRCKDLSLKDLLRCLSYHIRYQQNEQQIKVVRELMINLVVKFDSAEDEDDIIHMLSLWRSLSPEIIAKMESIALEMIGRSDEYQFKPKSLSYILVLMSKMKRRSKPLIVAIVNKFTYTSIDPMDCEPQYLIKMISALNQLNYSDIHFLKKSSDLLCNKKFLDSVAASDRRDLLVAVSQMNWSYPRLLSDYIEKLTNTNNDFSSQDFVVFVSSFARLYYKSNYFNEILSNYLIPYVKREDMDCESWLLYVWSLSILGCVPLECINSVMNNEFHNELMNCFKSESNDSLNYKQILSKLKLLNIKGVAEIEMNETIDFKPLSELNYKINKKEVSIEKFKTSTLQMLNSFIYNVSPNVLTPYGFTIDAEFIINKDFESLPLEIYGSLGADRSKEVEALPEGYKRVALMCFGFNDTLLAKSGLIGVHELSLRLLKRLGYSVVVVNENSKLFDSRNTQRIERLKTFIKNSFDSN